MTFFDRLSFVAGKRLGGGGKTERGFYDFAINEQPLTEILKPGDFIPPFGWLGSEVECQYFLRLLLRVSSQLPTGRIPLYICPECADLGCGCMSVKVARYDDSFVWSEFGFENSYEGLVQVEAQVRDFVFHKTEYYQALNRFGFE